MRLPENLFAVMKSFVKNPSFQENENRGGFLVFTPKTLLEIVGGLHNYHIILHHLPTDTYWEYCWNIDCKGNVIEDTDIFQVIVKPVVRYEIHPCDESQIRWRNGTAF